MPCLPSIDVGLIVYAAKFNNQLIRKSKKLRISIGLIGHTQITRHQYKKNDFNGNISSADNMFFILIYVVI